jgi:hypothetical protein
MLFAIRPDMDGRLAGFDHWKHDHFPAVRVMLNPNSRLLNAVSSISGNLEVSQIDPWKASCQINFFKSHLTDDIS